MVICTGVRAFARAERPQAEGAADVAGEAPAAPAVTDELVPRTVKDAKSKAGARYVPTRRVPSLHHPPLELVAGPVRFIVLLL